MVGESISAAFFFWLGKARMIKKPIRSLGFDVDIYSSIGKSEEATVWVGTFSFFFFFSFFYFFRSVFRV